MWRVVLVSLGLFMTCGRSASADLGSDVERLVRLWRPHYAVEQLPPRLMERGESLPIMLPTRSVDRSTRECTTLVAMGVTSAQLVLRFFSSDGDRRRFAWPQPSIAGVVALTRCGTRKAMLKDVSLEMRSPRGVVEFVVAHSEIPLPPVHRYLKNRDPGPAAGHAPFGPPPPPLALDERVRLLEDRNLAAGAAEQARRGAPSNGDGAGGIALHLMPGCHRVDVLGPLAPSQPGSPPPASSGDGSVLVAKPDIDVSLRWMADGSRVLMDRADSPDASLEFCLSAPDMGTLRFAGAPPQAQVTVLRASWPLPKGLPLHWGDRARARMAETIWDEYSGSLPAPVYESLGVAGQTSLPVELEPDACYLAAVAPLEGGASGVSLTAITGESARQNQSRTAERGTALAFCARGVETGLLRVQARSPQALWLLGLWQTNRRDLGEPLD